MGGSRAGAMFLPGRKRPRPLVRPAINRTRKRVWPGSCIASTAAGRCVPASGRGRCCCSPVSRQGRIASPLASDSRDQWLVKIQRKWRDHSRQYTTGAGAAETGASLKTLSIRRSSGMLSPFSATAEVAECVLIDGGREVLRISRCTSSLKPLKLRGEGVLAKHDWATASKRKPWMVAAKATYAVSRMLRVPGVITGFEQLRSRRYWAEMQPAAAEDDDLLREKGIQAAAQNYIWNERQTQSWRLPAGIIFDAIRAGRSWNDAAERHCADEDDQQSASCPHSKGATHASVNRCAETTSTGWRKGKRPYRSVETALALNGSA